MEEKYHSVQLQTVNTHQNVELARIVTTKEHLDPNVLKVNSNVNPGTFLGHPQSKRESTPGTETSGRATCSVCLAPPLHMKTVGDIRESLLWENIIVRDSESSFGNTVSGEGGKCFLQFLCLSWL